jgi:hypothetical protein
MQELCDESLILLGSDEANDGAFDHSSLDLHITEDAHALTQGSVKPFGSRYMQTLQRQGLAERLTSVHGQFRLERRRTYVFKIRERLPMLKGAPIFGQATAKSSVGRMDVLARLIVDGSHGYEEFRPEDLEESTGDMFLEVTPITFPVLVKPGISLSQLRFFFGAPDECVVSGKHLWSSLLRGTSTPSNGLISVELGTTSIAGHPASAFALSDGAKQQDLPIPLWRQNGLARPDPTQYWQLTRPIHEVDDGGWSAA